MADTSTKTDGSMGRALILVVEPHIRALERYFLEKAGFSVQFAETGIDALAQVKAQLPQIVISEILVPGLDGLSVCRALKQDPLTRSVKPVDASQLLILLEEQP
jgi:CheY-like chemotaxis protein